MFNFLRKIFGPRVEYHFMVDPQKYSVQERASAARALLSNPIFIIALEELKQEALALWEGTDADSVEQREFYWKHIKTLKQFKARVERYIKDAAYQDVIDKQRQAQEGQRETQEE